MIKHMEEIRIGNFRGIKNAHFKQLGSVNILVGGNNSGKTSALEAMNLFTNPLSARNIYEVAVARERYSFMRNRLSRLESINWLFPLNKEGNRDDIDIDAVVNKESIKVNIAAREEIFVKDLETNNKDLVQEEFLLDEFNAEGEENQRLILKIKYERNYEKLLKELEFTEDVFPRSPLLDDKEKDLIIRCNIITPVDHRIKPLSVKGLNDTILAGDRPKIIAALQYFDENIQGIELLMPKSNSYMNSAVIPFIDHKILGLTPITMFGDGIRKALTLASVLLGCQNGILFIDELETAIHTRMLGKLFKWLVNACKEFNIQLIATTHSLEAIDAIIEANEKELDELVAYRLESKEEETLVKRFSGEMLYDLRYQFGQDVR
ncbi:AAA family ATPase [Bacillus paranthracis]|uniref:AAA family ATPase n=1 Tax=Bacillus paranthracis TaxID=2026186 RepID=A0AAJ1NP64_9BACI|nr:AAA family ATPase [Bacillus paranthracis]MDG0948294.1 AAA family ATPase [Bacillus paranthracis]MDG0956628.1 AAA family ATPase [Bacillus paranthracis]